LRQERANSDLPASGERIRAARLSLNLAPIGLVQIVISQPTMPTQPC
jgi:hypothetical protein